MRSATHRTLRPLAAALACAFGLAACDATAPGREAYEAGRFADARRAFEEAAAQAGDGASAALRYDLALAALRTGDLTLAERAAAEAARLGDPGVAARAAFVRGNVAYERSLRAEAQAQRPGGDPTARERAVADVEDALAHWREAAMSRADWPEARRNVERALLRLQSLREKRSARGPGEAPPDGPTPPDRPPIPDRPPPESPAPPSDEAPETLGPAVVTSELPPSDVMALLDRLRAKDAEKAEVRRARRAERSSGVERDW